VEIFLNSRNEPCEGAGYVKICCLKFIAMKPYFGKEMLGSDINKSELFGLCFTFPINVREK
jgi:hypothetical protein